MCWKTVKHYRVSIFVFKVVDKKTASSVSSSSEIIDNTFLERVAPHYYRDDERAAFERERCKSLAFVGVACLLCLSLSFPFSLFFKLKSLGFRV